MRGLRGLRGQGGQAGQACEEKKREQILVELQNGLMSDFTKEKIQEELKRIPAAPPTSPTRELEQATGLQNSYIQKSKHSKVLHDEETTAISAKELFIKEHQEELDKMSKSTR